MWFEGMAVSKPVLCTSSYGRGFGVVWLRGVLGRCCDCNHFQLETFHSMWVGIQCGGAMHSSRKGEACWGGGLREITSRFSVYGTVVYG